MKALAIAAGIVFWTLVLGTAVLVFFPGGNAGEPVAVLQVEPAPPAAAPATAPMAPPPHGDTRGVDLPPGFAVTGPAQPQAPLLAPPDQGTEMVPVTPGQLTPPPQAPGPEGSLPQAPDRHGEAPPTESQAAAGGETQQAALGGVESPSMPADAPPEAAAEVDETGAVTLAAVPVPALVEESQYGPLPKVAADGRRPAEVYARPSRYAQAAGGPARVAVLVGGLGVPGAPDGDVIKGLPPPVSIAYGAYGRRLQEWVTKARADGHEVLLAIPLEPNNYPNEDPGPHTLLTTLPPEDNIKRLHWLMSRYTGYVGVTNHMGAKFEATQSALQPVLEELKRRGLIYVDDGGAEGSAAGQVAGALGLDYAVAQVRLEAKSAAELATALAQLEATAKERGTAIGVAKAEPATVKQIGEWASSLEGKGLVLVPVSAAVRAQRQS
ncbi:MAG: divergent polysaccharide deacetylase family protein [Methyloceanibacter sp.]|uniref:divergent polysaccharide deacetylase family protein n=1 Tax=Methyloceanibacter sp. TaxID=1965321 RepID=UPI003D6D64D6